MNITTPLTEVAAHLPTEAANHLDGYNTTVQELVLTQLRLVVSWIENDLDITLDPVAYATLITALVVSISPLYAQLHAKNVRIVELESKLMGAEALVNAMTEKLEAKEAPE